MSNAERVVKGLEIFLKYDADADVCAEHDVIYAGVGLEEKVSKEDELQLKTLGWHFDKEFDSWAKFV
jgi:hypothetical protein